MLSTRQLLSRTVSDRRTGRTQDHSIFRDSISSHCKNPA